MRLYFETDDVLIEITAPGTYSPDVADDMVSRIIDAYGRALTITHQHDTDDG